MNPPGPKKLGIGRLPRRHFSLFVLHCFPQYHLPPRPFHTFAACHPLIALPPRLIDTTVAEDPTLGLGLAPAPAPAPPIDQTNITAPTDIEDTTIITITETAMGTPTAIATIRATDIVDTLVMITAIARDAPNGRLRHHNNSMRRYLLRP